MRADIQKKLQRKEKEQKEEELRQMAALARMERSGVAPPREAKAGDGEGQAAASFPRESAEERAAREQRDR